jgi:molybdenum cofactor guanylyltransferase
MPGVVKRGKLGRAYHEEVADFAGVVLAGGRSSRMGTPKVALEWHGSTLLGRTAGIVARATGGPVVVVRASGQALPDLPAGVQVVDDPRDGKGPVQGIAAGLAALTGQAETAFICSTDMPFLHPAFIRRVLRVLADDAAADVALPVARGYQQPLAAAYRVRLAETAERLVEEDRLRPAFLFGECAVVRLDDDALRRDPVLRALDPDLDSVLNVNTPADYQDARARPAPEVSIQLIGAGPRAVRAATVGAAASAVGLAFGQHVTAALNGDQITRDPATPLATGDLVRFMSAGPDGERDAGTLPLPNRCAGRARRAARPPRLAAGSESREAVSGGS